MANLPESSTFTPGVYQLEVTDPVLAGPNGVTNEPLKALTNRTRFLKDHVDALESGTVIPPGVATESFVTGAINRQDIKSSVRVATTVNITLSGAQTIDGVALTAGERVLVKNQTAGQQNGLYLVQSGTWTRTTDADANDEVTGGMLVFVSEGTVQADTIWKLRTNDPIQVGTTPLVFADITEGFAPLASPVFTGNPTAPTPANGDNDTSLATTEFVQRTIGGVLSRSVAGGANVTLSAVEAGNGILIFTGALTANISVIVPGSPTRSWIVANNTTGAFTLTVRTAAGSGVIVAQGFIREVYTDGTNVLPALSDFTDAALAGNATAPTAPQFDNDLSVANTAFVQRALGNLQSATTITGNLTLTGADAGRLYVYGEPANITVTLPAFTAPAVGSVFEVLNTGPNTVTFAAAGTDQIDVGVETVNSVIIPPGMSLRIIRVALSSLWHAVTLSAAPYATPAQFNNTRALATTEFVQRALGNFRSFETISNSISLVEADAGKGYISALATNATITLPTIAASAVGAAFSFINTGTAVLTISRAGADQIDSGVNTVNTVALQPGQRLVIVRAAGSGVWHVFEYDQANTFADPVTLASASVTGALSVGGTAALNGGTTTTTLASTGNTALANNRWTADTAGNFQRVIPGGTVLYPDFACRAWVNFNGTGTIAIRGGGNVTSITDNAVGDYSVNFVTPMPDVNYSLELTSHGVPNGNQVNFLVEDVTNGTTPTKQTGSCRMRSQASGNGGGPATDFVVVNVAVFR